MQDVQQVADAAASNPPFVLYAALISAGVAIVVLIASNYYNSKREYEKWRREELSKTVLTALNTMSELKDKVARTPSLFHPALFANELGTLTDLQHSMNLLAASQKFGKKYTDINSEVMALFKNPGALDKQTLNVKINEIQMRFTQIAQWELRRTTWGPFRKALAVVAIVILLPLLIVLLIVLLVVQYVSMALNWSVNKLRDFQKAS